MNRILRQMGEADFHFYSYKLVQHKMEFLCCQAEKNWTLWTRVYGTVDDYLADVCIHLWGVIDGWQVISGYKVCAAAADGDNAAGDNDVDSDGDNNYAVGDGNAAADHNDRHDLLTFCCFFFFVIDNITVI